MPSDCPVGRQAHVFTCSRCGKRQCFFGPSRAESRQLLNYAGWWSKRVVGRSKYRDDKDLCPGCVKWAERFIDRTPMTAEEQRRGREIASEFGLLTKDSKDGD